MNEPSQIKLSVIARVESCYKEKFAVPRQPGLVPSGRALIRFLPEFAIADAVQGLEESSHIWVQFIFHKIGNSIQGWSPKVRPPRLGGNRKVGVFATRSTHRPNPMGLSVVKLERIDTSNGVVLDVSGIDLLDGTPVLDIKPYLPYADKVDGAVHGFAATLPEYLDIRFTFQALEQLGNLQVSNTADLRVLIEEILRQDPRPAYQRSDSSRIYGAMILNFNLRWRYIDVEGQEHIEVVGFDENQSV